MSVDHKQILVESSQAKVAAEMKLQATNLLYIAACFEGNKEQEERYRQEVHALTDIIMDNAAMVAYCSKQMSDKL